MTLEELFSRNFGYFYEDSGDYTILLEFKVVVDRDGNLFDYIKYPEEANKLRNMLIIESTVCAFNELAKDLDFKLEYVLPGTYLMNPHTAESRKLFK